MPDLVISKPFSWQGNHIYKQQLINSDIFWENGVVINFKDNKKPLIVVGYYNTEKLGVPENIKYDIKFFIYKYFNNIKRLYVVLLRYLEDYEREFNTKAEEIKNTEEIIFEEI